MKIEDIFDKYIPEKERTQVYRILYGKPFEDKNNEIPKEALELGEKYNFEIKHYSMVKNALKEEFRPPRIVRLALIQNSIVKPTNASVSEQVRTTCSPFI